MADKSEGEAQEPGEKEWKEALCRFAAALVYIVWKHAPEPVQALVKRIITSVSKSYKLFTGEVIVMGSRAQDFQVLVQSSSDYDFLVPIQYDTNLILMASPKGCLPGKESFETGVPVYLWGNKVMDYNKMRDHLKRKTGDVQLTEEHIKIKNNWQLRLWEPNLCPDRVMTEFRKCVREALTEEERNPVTGISNITLENGTPKCPAVQLTAKVNDRTVSIDLVPTIRNKVDMSMDWPQQDLRWLSDWWEREQGTEWIKPTWNIEEIYKIGADLVAKGSYWRLSFPVAETRLLRDINANDRRDALQRLKEINMEMWRPEYGKVLTSYHLKMVLFWASYLNPETEKWATVPDALGALLKVLEFSLEKKHLPSYFLPSVNLFDWRRSEEENSLKNLVLEALRLEVRLMRCSPQLYLRLSYDLAKPQGPGPFMQRARELDEFRREHWEDLEKFKNGEIPDHSKSRDLDEPSGELAPVRAIRLLNLAALLEPVVPGQPVL